MESIYMDYACMGRPSKEVLDSVNHAVLNMQDWNQAGTERTLKMFQEVEKARMKVAAFFHTKSENIMLVSNTTQGLGILAALTPLVSGNNILIPDIEFISSVLVWRQRQKQIGFEIRPVPTKNGIVRMEDFERVIDRNTKVIMVSAVQEVSGYRIDLQQLGELAKPYGAFVYVDGIQEAGVIGRSLDKLPIHAYCAGGHKWLGNPFGMGFMYVHPVLIHQFDPIVEGYLGLQEPSGGWDAYLKSRERTPFDQLTMLQEARKYESGGTPNWLGAIGLRASLEAKEQIGLPLIESKVKALVKRLRAKLENMGLQQYIFGSNEAEQSSGILTFRLPGGLEEEQRLLERLEKEKIHVSLRSISGIGGIRVSPYYDNSEEDIDHLVECVAKEHLSF